MVLVDGHKIGEQGAAFLGPESLHDGGPGSSRRAAGLARESRLQYGIRVTSEATVAARAVVNADGTTTLVVMNEWNYSDLRWGNYERVKELPPHFRGEIHMQFVH